MRNHGTVALTLCVALTLAGCASSDHVLFVTKTSLGIDFDSKPASASIAYDRVEGYVAPRYSNGEIPPVVASVKSDGAIFNPRIRQIYATGEAAEIVLHGRVKEIKARPLRGTKELMFFGTTTTTGLKVGFATGLPDSLIFGFKRKEFSYIPLATTGTGSTARDLYPSVLAAIDTAAKAGQEHETGLNNSQFFATGVAARLLAANDGVRRGFEAAAREAIQAQQLKNVELVMDESGRASALVDDIVKRYDATTTEQQKQTIIGFAQDGPIDPGREMNLDNFKARLFRFMEEDPAPGVQVLGVLADLNAKIDKFLAK